MTIQVHFKRLAIIIDVYFLLIKEDTLKLLFIEDMLDNGLDLLIQGRYVSLKERRRTLAMEKYFVTQIWSEIDIPYALYTEVELQTLHRSIDHPLERALSMSMERVSGATIKRSITDLL